MANPTPTRVAVHGAAGRMGRGLLTAVLTHDGASLEAAIVRDNHPQLGRDIVKGAPPLTSDRTESLAQAQVLIDFSSPAGAVLAAEAAAERGIPYVTGTTGLDDAQQARIIELSQTIPIVASPNMSVGVNALLGLVYRAAQALVDWDCEIHEIHHKHKKDAPSGTALAIADTLADARGLGSSAIRTARSGFAPRLPHEITVVASRGGDVVGEHTTFLFGDGERLELTHRATDRKIFVTGALRAGLWVVGKPSGLYSMQDVLFGSNAVT